MTTTGSQLLQSWPWRLLLFLPCFPASSYSPRPARGCRGLRGWRLTSPRWCAASRRSCSAPTRSSPPGTTAATSRTSPLSWPASTTSWGPPTARSACATSFRSFASCRVESWHQSKLININSLVCVYVNLLIIVFTIIFNLVRPFKINCIKVKTFLLIRTPSSTRLNCAGFVTTVMLFSGTKPQSPSDYARIVELTSQWQLIFIIKQWIIETSAFIRGSETAGMPPQ